jgi:hypothetical protein
MSEIALSRQRTVAAAPLPPPASTLRIAAQRPALAPDRVDRTVAGDRSDPGALHAFGAGVLAGASAEAGLLGGLGATASAGVGIFYDGKRSIHAGSFAGAGAFAGAGESDVKTSPSADPVNVVGAFAGMGIGAFVTNAASAKQLSGVAQTYSVNLGVGPLKLSVQVGSSDGTYVGAVSVGPGIGLDASRYPTQSTTRTW